jgi:hypothetical protein
MTQDRDESIRMLALSCGINISYREPTLILSDTENEKQAISDYFSSIKTKYGLEPESVKITRGYSGFHKSEILFAVILKPIKQLLKEVGLKLNSEKDHYENQLATTKSLIAQFESLEKGK